MTKNASHFHRLRVLIFLGNIQWSAVKFSQNNIKLVTDILVVTLLSKISDMYWLRL